MSGKISGMIWDLDLPQRDMLVLQAYADHADHTGNGVRPSIGLIAWKTGYSPRQIQRIVKGLVEQGIMVVVKQHTARKGDKGTTTQPTEYRIVPSAGKQKKPYAGRTHLAQERQLAPPCDTAVSHPSDVTGDVTSGCPIPCDIQMSHKPSDKTSVKPSDSDDDSGAPVMSHEGTAPDEVPPFPSEPETVEDEAALHPYTTLLTFNEIYGSAAVDLARAAAAVSLSTDDLKLTVLYARRLENARKVDNWRGWLIQSVRNSGWASVAKTERDAMEPKRKSAPPPSRSAPVIYGTLPDPPPIPNHIKLLTPEERRAIRRRAFEEVGHALTD